MKPLLPVKVLEVGKTYRDKRGVEWTVQNFMYDEGRWFVEHENGDYVALSRAGVKKQRWVKIKTFVASLAPSEKEST